MPCERRSRSSLGTGSTSPINVPFASSVTASRSASEATTREHSEVAERHFTPEEANALLPQVRELAARMVAHRRSLAVASCVDELNALGVQVKDLDDGLVDFPAWRGDEEVLLCWRLGEDEVAFWHGADEGFAGRKPLPIE